MKPIPKDRQIIISTFEGMRVAIWSEADSKFTYANLQVDMHNGKYNMYCYETEYIEEKDITAWREL